MKKLILSLILIGTSSFIFGQRPFEIPDMDNCYAGTCYFTYPRDTPSTKKT